MTLPLVSHEESLELVGLYVLDGLTRDEMQAVDAHLEDCPQEHPEYAEFGAVVSALALIAEPIAPPLALKAAVLDAYRSEVGTSPARSQVKPWTIDVGEPASATAAPASRSRMPAWIGWAAAGVAILLLAVLSVAGLNLRSQLDHANQVADERSKAIVALTAPGARVAILHGSGPAAGVNGFAAFPVSTTGGGYMVLTDVPPAPTGKTYQGWYIVDGSPTSIGTMAADADGNVIASGLEALAGTDSIAVTVEPQGGSAQPTSDPIIVGTVTTTS
ncbi:MAG: anti-sigma factor [Chloroflexota bacterium]